MASAGENLRKTFNHENPDRMVVDLRASPVTDIHVLVAEQFKKHFGLEQKPECSETVRGSAGFLYKAIEMQEEAMESPIDLRSTVCPIICL